ncbi:CU044_5270 family protein [Streptomyces sp. NPDC054871]
MSDFPERDLPPGRHQLLREHLLTEIRQNEIQSEEKTPKTRKSWFRPALIAGAVAASVVAGVLVASPFGDQAAQAGPPSKETVRMLEEIAAAAKEQPAPKDVRDDQFVYIKSKVGYMASGEGKTQIQPIHEREYWQSVDGKHTEMLHEPQNDFTNEPMPPDLPLVEGDASYRSLQKLPTDPVNMLDWLHRVSDGGKSEDQNTFVLVGDLSYESLMPPKQAAALYLAASKIPGVKLIEDAVDAEGRHGIAIAREDDGERQELIFDKKTKQFIGERQVAVEDLPTGFEKGTVTGRSAILERTIVDKAGQRP